MIKELKSQVSDHNDSWPPKTCRQEQNMYV